MLPPRIVVATLNARYSHASFGLRYLLANLGPYRAMTVLREFTIGQPPLQIVESLLAEAPSVIGFGVYIWNVAETTAVMELLRALRPDIRLVIGGPEVSYEYAETAIFGLCDHLIPGEADIAFRELVAEVVQGRVPPKVFTAAAPELAALRLPYDEYTDTDLRERLIYVEASRGCPFHCEFCLSSLDERVRPFPLPAFLAALQRLLERGARGFKFVDRTFNLNLRTSVAILEFCLSHYRPGLELHFEMIPDRLPTELRALLARFPAGAVQLEIGIQSFTKDVLQNISRPQNIVRIADNLSYLRQHTGVHVHADLIFGLPGETLESFAASFDQLLALGPDEIQLGFLKRLRGTPIIRHTETAALRFSPRPPYEILENATVGFTELQRMRRFARYFDLFFNSGEFVLAMEAVLAAQASPFAAFAQFADWLYATTGQTHELALTRRYQLIFSYLTTQCAAEPAEVAELLLCDYDRHKVRRERLEFLRPYVASLRPSAVSVVAASRAVHTVKRRGQAPAGALAQTVASESAPALLTAASPPAAAVRRLPVLPTN